MENEQWMGWPLGPQYAALSNVDNAYRLQGKALIIIGEMDSNVVPGQNHGVGVLATHHYRDDYFVHNLLGVEPPDWNRVSLPAEPTATGGN